MKLEPSPEILIESLRDIGYSFETAVADIIDNSIAANATRVEIFLLPDRLTNSCSVTIKDNGWGLDRNELINAMRLGSKSPREKRDPSDLGRFGLGLKTASFSQCRKLNVFSRKNDELSGFTWDLDHIASTNEWSLLETTNFLDYPQLNQLNHDGTVIIWQNTDRIDGSKIGDYVEKLITHLGIVFHRFIQPPNHVKVDRKVEIFVNGNAVVAIDPFCRHNKATQVDDEEYIQNVRMQVYTLPRKEKHKSLEEYNRYALPGGYQKNQGIYLYRSNRLILWGTWFNLLKKSFDSQLTRVELDMDNTSDVDWSIDVKKVFAQLPFVVKHRLEKLTNTIPLRSKRTINLAGRAPIKAESYPVWEFIEKDKSISCRIVKVNPIFKGFLESLSDDQKQYFLKILKLLEHSLPIEQIIFRLHQPNSSFNNTDISDAERESLKNLVLSVFTEQGLGEANINEVVKNYQLEVE
ncbi:hypothetical protein BK816_00215 [Boudabousia tangfeifanii]|uniref:ATP-binding protein n=1 Tax=Boudabousia tangfeifanii TaxID=1912795 RepID=A0A1D9MI13_9ACTO|nr:ATP-binding protein [Boudabousia tangfeifanii]AOZ71906.1 hypothetical protein BK816_00215 [Boudabousia tangfeifanii]